MSDGGIEWVGWVPLESEPQHVPEVNIPEARALQVGPDDVLVIVFPWGMSEREMNQHRMRMREVLGDRFLLLLGDDIRLAKIPAHDWATGVINSGEGT